MKTKLHLILFLLALGFFTNISAQCPAGTGNWLSTQGNKLIDSNGNIVKLSGVNWFGFETQLSSPHGIWSRDHKSVLQQMKDLGFNCFRIPWHNRMLESDASISINSYGTDPYTGVSPMNELESTFTKPIELLDELVQWCQDNDMKIILDCHSRNPDAYLVEKRWYTSDFTQQQWIDDWVFLADRYKDYDAVIGMDINNEPNGKIDNPEGARWGTGNVTDDWRLAAQECGNAILEANPNVLIIVEGIEAYTKPDGTQTSYWWGGNLQGARDYPVVISDPSKLMYSPHEYGPTVFEQVWFSDPTFPDNMAGIWEEQFNFLNTENTSPLFVGELGIKTQGGADEVWFSTFINYIRDNNLHYTFWALNPNSGDTGGILDNDWSTVVQWKMDYLQDIIYDPIPNCSFVLGVNDFDTNNTVKLFPVPTTNILNISDSKGIEAVSIYDLNGRLINHIPFKTKLFNYELNTSELSNGFYMLQVQGTNDRKFTSKFVKE